MTGSLLAACGPGRAPAVPEEVLPLASDTVEAAWGTIPVAAPTGANRWAVVAGDWDAAAIADFGSRTMTPLGGRKQSAYVHPFAVFNRGDTVFLSDWGKRRTTVWSGQGELIDSIPAADALRGSLPRARDAAGQFYFELMPVAGRDGSGNRDSAAIVRAPRSYARFDTAAQLAPLDLKEMQRENSRRFERLVFSGTDEWGIWPDGTIWVARLLRNQIETIDPLGKRHRGPELPDPVFEVTQADRDRYLQGFPNDTRPNEADLPFALIHPPFVAAFNGPGASIWLEKSKPVLDSVRRIHVLDREGNLKRTFRLHGAGRMIAVGDSAILVAEQFAQGIRLMQVKIPAEAPRPIQ